MEPTAPDAQPPHPPSQLSRKGLRRHFFAVGRRRLLLWLLLQALLLAAVNAAFTWQGEHTKMQTLANTLQREMMLRNAGDQLEILRRVTRKTGVHSALLPGHLSPMLADLSPLEIRDAEAPIFRHQKLGEQWHYIGIIPLKHPFAERRIVLANPVHISHYLRPPTDAVSLWALLTLGFMALIFWLGPHLLWRRHAAAIQRLADSLSDFIETAGQPHRQRADALLRDIMSPWPVVDSALLLLKLQVHAERAIYADAWHEVSVLDAARKEHLTTVAQEILAPRVHISCLAQELRDASEALKETQREDVDIIYNACQKLIDMVREMVGFSTLLDDDIPWDSDPIDVDALLHEVAKESRGKIGNKGLAMQTTIDPAGPLFVRGSRQRLWQVVTNLVQNSLRFTETGHIELAVQRAPDQRVAIFVRDTGCGIARSDLKRVFNAFEQSGTRMQRKGGSGLGLAISRELVKQHGGDIAIDSILGQGTTVTIHLPEILP